MSFLVVSIFFLIEIKGMIKISMQSRRGSGAVSSFSGQIHLVKLVKYFRHWYASMQANTLLGQ